MFDTQELKGRHKIVSVDVEKLAKLPRDERRLAFVFGIEASLSDGSAELIEIRDLGYKLLVQGDVDKRKYVCSLYDGQRKDTLIYRGENLSWAVEMFMDSTSRGIVRGAINRVIPRAVYALTERSA